MNMKRICAVCSLILISQYLFASGQPEANTDIDHFNEALTHYQEQDYKKTDEILKTMGTIKNEYISENFMMLSGNNAYRYGKSLIEETGSTEQVSGLIDNSISWYQRILQINSENKIASHNLELANTLKEQLNQNKSREQAEQQKQDELKNQLEELQNKQEKLASDNQKGSEDHKSQQEELQNETGSLNDQLSENEKDVQQQMDISEELQKKAIEEIEQNNFKKAEEYQKEAAESLQKAADMMSGEKTEKKDSPEESESENNTDQTARDIIENENNRESSTESSGEGTIINRNW